MKYLLCVFCLFAVLVSCERKKTPCEVVTCTKSHQICADGVCKCDSNSYSMGQWCYPKQRGDKMVFYNTSSFICFDTIVFLINSRPTDGTYFPNNPGANKTARELGVDAIFPRNEKGGWKAVAADYFAKPDGDSIFISQYYGLMGFLRKNNTEQWNPMFKGKFNKAADTLTLQTIWFVGGVAVDSLKTVLSRKS